MTTLNRYKNIYFDLDNTLWDFGTNAREAFKEIFETYQLWDKISDFEKFILTLKQLDIRDNFLSKQISEAYLELVPQKSNLVSNAYEVLDYLKSKYSLFILTNGFHDTQNAKLINSGIQHYFSGLFTSEDARWSKPDRRFFAYALKSVNAKKSESLMVGDDLHVDIAGAKNFGMDQVFYNRKMISHQMKITYEIKELKELMLIL